MVRLRNCEFFHNSYLLKIKNSLLLKGSEIEGTYVSFQCVTIYILIQQIIECYKA